MALFEDKDKQRAKDVLHIATSQLALFKAFSERFNSLISQVVELEAAKDIPELLKLVNYHCGKHFQCQNVSLWLADGVPILFSLL